MVWPMLNYRANPINDGITQMHKLLKSTVLGVGLLMGVTAAAYAQSVANLPPTSPATAPTATVPPVSTANITPDPGSNGKWKEEHYQATQSDNDPGRHPYTVPHFGPAPN
jgi:hypothetical protein